MTLSKHCKIIHALWLAVCLSLNPLVTVSETPSQESKPHKWWTILYFLFSDVKCSWESRGVLQLWRVWPVQEKFLSSLSCSGKHDKSSTSLTQIPFYIDVRNTRKLTDRCPQVGLREVSCLSCVRLLAAVVPAELAYWSLKLPLVWPWESAWRTAGTAEHMQREGEYEWARDEEEGGERDSPFLPPLWPPALLSSTLQTPFPWPPRMQIPGLRPKYQNSKSIQIAGGTTTHRFTQMPNASPPPRPTTHLVSFKLSPKLSHLPPFSPSPFLFTPPPPSIYTYLPHLFLFFFHKPTKNLALVQSDMGDIYSRRERS